ncbi:unnamed protein product, partial [Discosporangium mesarthrocarpum]
VKGEEGQGGTARHKGGMGDRVKEADGAVQGDLSNAATAEAGVGTRAGQGTKGDLQGKKDRGMPSPDHRESRHAPQERLVSGGSSFRLEILRSEVERIPGAGSSSGQGFWKGAASPTGS